MDNRLTVLQVIYSFQMGGSERMASTIASGIDRSRFRPLVCGLNGGGPMSNLLQEKGIPCFILNRRDGWDLSLPPKLYRILRNERVDVIQTHHLGQFLYPLLPARLLGLPVIYTEHSYHAFLQSGRLRWLARRILPSAWRVVAVGEDVRRFLSDRIGIPPERMEVIHQGLSVPDEKSDEDAAWRESLGLGQNSGPVIGHVARLTAVKDQEGLLRAFARVLHVRPDARLVIVGDGELRDRLAALSAELGLDRAVRFLGFRSDVERILKAFDLFVLSSYTEGLPISLLEAMAAGRPVVATSVGCIPDLLRNGAAGVLVPPRSPETLADAILKLLSDPSARMAYAQAGRREVETRFSLNKMVQRYESIYREAVESRRRLRP